MKQKKERKEKENMIKRKKSYLQVKQETLISNV